MPTATLDRRTLNRTLLDRQLLLGRPKMAAEDAVARLLGLQSQTPNSPYPGLWSRLAGFDFGELGELLTERRAVRLVLMRSTVHLVTAADALGLRLWLRPALDRGLRSSRWAPGVAGVDRAELVAYGRRLLAAEPLGPPELRAGLGERFPAADPESLVSALRVWAPLVQVPPRGLWGASGGPRYAFLDAWLDAPLTAPDPAGLVRRYLAGYGPATPADMQKWSGMTGLKTVFAGMDLRSYAGEDGRILYDLPDAPLTDPGTPVPARYVAEFDNVLLSHADRTRILADEHRPRVMTVNGIIRGSVLIDGFVGGTWRFARTKGTAAVVVTPFAALRAADRDRLAEEGARLLSASDPAAGEREVRFEKP